MLCPSLRNTPPYIDVKKKLGKRSQEGEPREGSGDRYDRVTDQSDGRPFSRD